jgi:hypothetical protein
MTNLRPRPLALLALLASIAITVILAAGCGGGNGKSSDAAKGTIEDQIGFSQSGIVERQSRVEGAIRDCMKAQGFDYVPVDPVAQRAALTGKARMSDDEFVKQFGYGISTLFGRGNAQSDPNDRIRKGLSTADRAAYDRTLWGDNPGATFAEAVDIGHFDQLGGCTKQATQSVFGGTAVLSNLQKKLDALDERVLADQRMVKAVESWTTCMSKEGFRYTDPEEIDGDLKKRFESIVGVGVRPGATNAPNPGTSYDAAALTDLQREEVKIGTADLKCEKQEITPVENKVRPQYETDFRQQNRQLLSQVKPSGG